MRNSAGSTASTIRRGPRSYLRLSLMAAACAILAACTGGQGLASTVPQGTVTKAYADGPFGQIHYYRSGVVSEQKRPLVLLHPTASSGYYYFRLIPELSRDRLVIAVDTPGYGRSDAPAEPQSVSALAQAILSVPDAMDIGSFDIFGYNTGAALALEMARQQPERVARLVVIGPPFDNEDVRAQRFEQLVQDGPVREDAEFATPYWRAYVTNRSSDTALEDGARLFAERMLSYPRSDWGYRAVFSEDHSARFSEIAQPVLIATHNDCDEDVHRRALAILPNAECAQAPHLQGGAIFSNAAQLASSITEFLDRI